jgi:hypothetical protein
MLSRDDLVWVLIGIVFLGAIVFLALHFTSESRLRKRRRKSHSPVIAKSNKPMVKFSVKPPKE